LERLTWLRKRWHWRPERAMYLDRVQVKQLPVPAMVKEVYKSAFKEVWSLSRIRRLRNRRLTKRRMGLLPYLKFSFSTRVFPEIYNIIWSVNSWSILFVSVWFLLGFVAVPLPWFLDEYYVV